MVATSGNRIPPLHRHSQQMKNRIFSLIITICYVTGNATLTFECKVNISGVGIVN